DVDVGARGAAVTAGGVSVPAGTGDAAAAPDADAIGLAAVTEVDVGLALLVDPAGDAAEAGAGPAVRTAARAADREAAGPAAAALGGRVRVGDLVLAG